MKVKVFTAQSMQEAMSQVKNDLGRDAVILHTRRLKKGGILGFGGKEMIEVMAAVESTPVAATTERKNLPFAYPEEQRYQTEYSRKNDLHIELASMRKMLEQVLHKVPKTEKNNLLVELLTKNDVERKIAEDLLKDSAGFSSLQQPEVIREILYDRIVDCLQRVEGIHIPANGSKIVAFIGPTGVGKTTTIAKLAAHFSINKGYKVAMVTADTYRISAVEQLKTYADIIGVPIEIVYSPDELKSALQNHQDKQLILIDTAGRSPHNQYQLAELQAFLEIDSQIETHLVLSTTTKYKDALDIVRKFSVCSPQKFLFTKVDEASNVGTIINLVCQFPTTLSYITNGQNVPDDIELADPQKLANLILRD
jgi:flagellar biosynthesis protein FlhF